MSYPTNLRYTETHEWARVDGASVVVGITDFAVHSLQDLVFIDLPKVGAKVEKGKRFGEIESVKAVSDLYAPITGAVVERNERLMQELDLLAKDPFGAGWMLKIRMEKPSEANNLLDDAAYQKVIDADNH